MQDNLRRHNPDNTGEAKLYIVNGQRKLLQEQHAREATKTWTNAYIWRRQNMCRRRTKGHVTDWKPYIASQ